MPDDSPTARALLVLEMVQNSPGIKAERIAQRLGVSERAARRYVAILREAEVPIESERGRYGGYRLGRGLRVPPLMFTADEALGLVMAVLEAHRGAGEDPVGTALDKIIRVLPGPVAEPAAAVRRVGAPDPRHAGPAADPATTARLAQACAAGRRIRLTYRTDRDRSMDVDPWSVVVWRGRWYLLGWSHSAEARRVLRVDRVSAVETLEETFTAPDIDPVATLEDHLAQGWAHEIEVLIHAPLPRVARWLPRSLGRLEDTPEGTRLRGSTNELDWYAVQLAAIQAPFRVVRPPALQAEVAALGRNLVAASHGPAAPEAQP